MENYFNRRPIITKFNHCRIKTPNQLKNMKTKRILRITAAALLFSTLNPLLSTCFAQGSLTPPGAPAPTMKTLAQIEPRTPILTAPFTISAPGSYYLTTNLSVTTGNAITIAANGVTLDLSGFTISSTAASATGYGILLSGGLQNLTIKNGFIQGGVINNGSGVYSGGGFAYGIRYSSSGPTNVLVSRISVVGVLDDGIYLGDGPSMVVESCTVATAGGKGILATIIRGSSAVDCGSVAIFGNQVTDCNGQSTGSTGLDGNTANNCSGVSSGSGTIGLSGSMICNCYGSSSSGTGLSALTANNCYGSSSSGNGLNAQVANNCSGFSLNGGTGLYVYYTADNCYGSSGSGTGLYSGFTANNCKGHSASGNGLYCGQIAIGCYGESNTGTGLQANIANSCAGFGATPYSVVNKYNMP